MIQMFCSPLMPVYGYQTLRFSRIQTHCLNSGNFLAIALSIASSSSSDSSMSDSLSSSLASITYSLPFLESLFLFFFFLDFGGRGIFWDTSHFSCFYLASFLGLSSSFPSTCHSQGLQRCSKAVGSSIISLRSLSLLSQTFIATLSTFSLTLVLISPSSELADSLSSLTYYLTQFSAFTAIYSY